jgi:late competence protein required for DNA uptake (superfamily II DNA/RNA helicase)
MDETVKQFTRCRHEKDAGRVEQLPAGSYHCQRCINCGQLLAIQKLVDRKQGSA